jgi:hypothetical protein
MRSVERTARLSKPKQVGKPDTVPTLSQQVPAPESQLGRDITCDRQSHSPNHPHSHLWQTATDQWRFWPTGIFCTLISTKLYFSKRRACDELKGTAERVGFPSSRHQRHTPFTNPLNPSWLAPTAGAATRPINPAPMPFPMLLAPLASPAWSNSELQRLKKGTVENKSEKVNFLEVQESKHVDTNLGILWLSQTKNVVEVELFIPCCRASHQKSMALSPIIFKTPPTFSCSHPAVCSVQPQKT